MLSYQHGFHAGNHADVLKHSILTLILARLAEKDRPLTYMDSHAGAGYYDLNGERALKTGEASSGILRLLGRDDPPGKLKPYLDLCERLYADGARYPGSPGVASALTRPDDNLILMELHPAERERLKASMSDDRRCHVHFRDGFAGLAALSPPTPRRGLALVDPSYETEDDYANVAKAVRTLARRWPEGIVAVWYPLVARKAAGTETLKADVVASATGGVLCAELRAVPRAEPRAGLRAETYPNGAPEGGWGMYGSGMLVANPPWRLDEDISGILPWLSRTLEVTEEGSASLVWLSPKA